MFPTLNESIKEEGKKEWLMAWQNTDIDLICLITPFDILDELF